jgi:UDP-glucuronate 4-epimerase
MKNILVTGAAGFIGYHLCERLIKIGHTVIGLDNLNDYYDVNLKIDRLKELGINSVSANEIVFSTKHGDKFQFVKIDIEDHENLQRLFNQFQFDVVCNLAAQAGVRYSIEEPKVYVDTNIVGFMNLLECMRQYNVKKLVYASSSSVYGNNAKIPFGINDKVDEPISLYAASKKANELMAHTYSHLFDIETIGLRFFTVYGPWGRPDMAMYLFTDAILNDRPIKVFNNGDLFRDFTYIDDIINGVIATIEKELHSNKKYRIYNIGNGNPVKLIDFIVAIESYIGKKALKENLPMQPGDVSKTWADLSELNKDYNYKPLVSVKQGIGNFIVWFKDYYNVVNQ